jgi:hypothetical protein
MARASCAAQRRVSASSVSAPSFMLDLRQIEMFSADDVGSGRGRRDSAVPPSLARAVSGHGAEAMVRRQRGSDKAGPV